MFDANFTDIVSPCQKDDLSFSWIALDLMTKLPVNGSSLLKPN